MLGVSITASVGLAVGSLGNSLVSAQDFNDKLQLALESSTTSLASLQRQVTSIAQVALQNRCALDLLTAEKGGTCIFLQEECCYYINKSGVVEQNVQTLTKLSEELCVRHSRNNSLFGWFQSPLATWVLPMIGPLILICVFFLLAPCLLKFIRFRIVEMSQDGGFWRRWLLWLKNMYGSKKCKKGEQKSQEQELLLKT
ncbi:endogenous retrovirus group FC1 Env polyprotein-like [Myotis myotis]|uniref:endogenous retrovirus group FC1 Env polyprotein-like n=1 Tax=Myotis myotis TaxID=51298 RepID=UPI00174AD841|nr:endogenous retrovirus group FC1 Env polyprotein-like [Myotis myotis]